MAVNCEAQLGWRLEDRDGYPVTVAEVCGQVVGVSGYLGADGARHVYCPAPRHQDQVRRRFPERLYRDSDGGIHPAGDIERTLGVDLASLIRDFEHAGQQPERVR